MTKLLLLLTTLLTVYTTTALVAPVATLKPAAVPLLEAGKSLARAGELFIDYCQATDCYGGPLSQSGASIRNSGDYMAQAAASMRFKTGLELVSSELRESADCLLECSMKLKQSVEEELADDIRSDVVTKFINPMKECSESLEASGAGVMQRLPIKDIGELLLKSGDSLNLYSEYVLELVNGQQQGVQCVESLTKASMLIQKAGQELTGKADQADSRGKGKSWIKA